MTMLMCMSIEIEGQQVLWEDVDCEKTAGCCGWAMPQPYPPDRLIFRQRRDSRQKIQKLQGGWAGQMIEYQMKCALSRGGILRVSGVICNFLKSTNCQHQRKCLTSNGYQWCCSFGNHDIDEPFWEGLRKRNVLSGVSLPRSWKQRKQGRVLP